MRLLIVLAGMSLAFSANLWGQDMGTVECGDAQQAAQDVVANDGPFMNRGQLVRTVLNTVLPLVKSGVITENCQSCIVMQFAQGVPIVDQGPCGPIPDPGFCDNPAVIPDECDPNIFPRCNQGGNCGDAGFCFPIVGGSPPNSGVCDVLHVCGGLEECPNGQSDCAQGEICAETCCDPARRCLAPICLPAP